MGFAPEMTETYQQIRRDYIKVLHVRENNLNYATMYKKKKKKEISSLL